MYALITGTTNGIGYSIAEKLLFKNLKVIGVDKKKNVKFKNKNFYSEKLNILDEKSVFNFLKKLKVSKKIPQCFILSAGVNIYDNDKYFDIKAFKKCFDINFYGVINFVNAIDKLNIKNKKIIAISSVSIIVPNIKSLGYYSSKILLKQNLSLLNYNKTNSYKTIILGPVKTKISRNLKKPKGIAGIIYKFLQISKEKAANRIINCIDSSKRTIYITFLASFVFYLIKLVLIIWPNLYMNNDRKKFND